VTEQPDKAGRVEIRLVGEFDMTNAPKLRETLSSAVESGGNPIVLNMALVTFIDSAGLGELIRAHNHLPAERSIVLREVKPLIEKLLTLTGLSTVFDIEA
jgi:anti-sigma B factor antagonist